MDVSGFMTLSLTEGEYLTADAFQIDTGKGPFSIGIVFFWTDPVSHDERTDLISDEKFSIVFFRKRKIVISYKKGNKEYQITFEANLPETLGWQYLVVMYDGNGRFSIDFNGSVITDPKEGYERPDINGRWKIGGKGDFCVRTVYVRRKEQKRQEQFHTLLHNKVLPDDALYLDFSGGKMEDRGEKHCTLTGSKNACIRHASRAVKIDTQKRGYFFRGQDANDGDTTLLIRFCVDMDEKDRAILFEYGDAAAVLSMEDKLMLSIGNTYKVCLGQARNWIDLVYYIPEKGTSYYQFAVGNHKFVRGPYIEARQVNRATHTFNLCADFKGSIEYCVLFNGLIGYEELESFILRSPRVVNAKMKAYYTYSDNLRERTSLVEKVSGRLEPVYGITANVLSNDGYDQIEIPEYYLEEKSVSMDEHEKWQADAAVRIFTTFFQTVGISDIPGVGQDWKVNPAIYAFILSSIIPLVSFKSLLLAKQLKKVPELKTEVFDFIKEVVEKEKLLKQVTDLFCHTSELVKELLAGALEGIISNETATGTALATLEDLGIMTAVLTLLACLEREPQKKKKRVSIAGIKAGQCDIELDEEYTQEDKKWARAAVFLKGSKPGIKITLINKGAGFGEYVLSLASDFKTIGRKTFSLSPGETREVDMQLPDSIVDCRYAGKTKTSLTWVLYEAGVLSYIRKDTSHTFYVIEGMPTETMVCPNIWMLDFFSRCFAENRDKNFQEAYEIWGHSVYKKCVDSKFSEFNDDDNRISGKFHAVKFKSHARAATIEASDQDIAALGFLGSQLNGCPYQAGIVCSDLTDMDNKEKRISLLFQHDLKNHSMFELVYINGEDVWDPKLMPHMSFLPFTDYNDSYITGGANPSYYREKFFKCGSACRLKVLNLKLIRRYIGEEITEFHEEKEPAPSDLIVSAGVNPEIRRLINPGNQNICHCISIKYLETTLNNFIDIPDNAQRGRYGHSFYRALNSRIEPMEMEVPPEIEDRYYRGMLDFINDVENGNGDNNIRNHLYNLIINAYMNLKAGDGRWNSSIGKAYDPKWWVYVNADGNVIYDIHGSVNPPEQFAEYDRIRGFDHLPGQVEGFYLLNRDDGKRFSIMTVLLNNEICLYTGRTDQPAERMFVYSSNNTFELPPRQNVQGVGARVFYRFEGENLWMETIAHNINDLLPLD